MERLGVQISVFVGCLLLMLWPTLADLDGASGQGSFLFLSACWVGLIVVLFVLSRSLRKQPESEDPYRHPGDV